MGQLQQYKEDFILMAEAGFIAINQTDEDAAVKLFKASSLLDPANVLPKIGFGYMHLCKLELKQACKYFEEILTKDPKNEMALTFLGLSTCLNPVDCAKGEKILQQSMESAQDPMVKGLAKSSLEFVERFIKKAPVPGQSQPEKKKEKK